MITKSGIDTSKFDSCGVGSFNTGLEGIYTADIPTKLYVLENDHGMEVCITNLGARIVSCMVPDKFNKFKDVVLGFDNIEQYADFNNTNNVFGAVVGRYANRIGSGKFNIDSHEYSLPINNGSNCLHGGPYGWQYQTFNVVEYSDDKSKIVLNLVSPDGDSGFPGEVNFSVTYTLRENNTLSVKYSATTTKDTVINVTNHSYFNLEGDPNCSTLSDKLFVAAHYMTNLGDETLPNGEISKIKHNGPFDFYEIEKKGDSFVGAKSIGQDIKADHPQIVAANGYDNNFIVLDRYQTMKEKGINFDNKMNFAAKLSNENSGIAMSIFTSMPGVQLYDAVDLDGSIVGKNNIAYQPYSAVCLETQSFPDSPNKNFFPSTLLTKGEQYIQYTDYQFDVVK